MSAGIREVIIGFTTAMVFSVAFPGCSSQETEPPAPIREHVPVPSRRAVSLPLAWGLVYKPQSAQVQERLVELGMRFDCYFTCEEFLEKMGLASIFQETILPANFEPTTREEMMKGLAEALPGFRVATDPKSPAVVRIRDHRLTGRVGFGLDHTVEAKFSGSPSELLQWLEKRQTRVNNPLSGIISGGVRVNDSTSPLVIRKYEGSTRRLLTTYLPLSDYRRVLWVAQSSAETGKLETYVRFSGRMTGTWFRPKPPFPDTVDFSLGDSACKINAGRPQQIPAAIQFIDDHLKPGASPLQVRWAMIYLGREKAKDGIPVLLKHIDYLYTPWGVVREAYPAVRALAEIGPEGAEACIERLRLENNPLHCRLLCQVLLDQQGAEKAAKTLKDRAAKVADAEERGRLVAAEKIVAALAKE